MIWPRLIAVCRGLTNLLNLCAHSYAKDLGTVSNLLLPLFTNCLLNRRLLGRIGETAFPGNKLNLRSGTVRAKDHCV
jgi:hypothetical protein